MMSGRAIRADVSAGGDPPLPCRAPGRSVRRRFRLVTGVVFVVGLVLYAARCRARSGMDREMVGTIERVRSRLKPLNLAPGGAASFAEDELAYFRYYGLDVEDADHRFGTFRSAGFTIAAHVFRPPRSRATVIVSHGYYDHAGVWRHAIRHLVKQGYTVAVYDQPGHGLSSGDRSTIASFKQYVTVLRGFVSLCIRHLESPHHIVAHSMGCAVTADYLLHTEPAPVDKVILLAPLVRSAAWGVSGVGHAIGGRVLDSVPRKFRQNTSDEAFLAFQREDPLQARTVPMQWVKAHREWVKAFEGNGSSKRRVLVLQGDKDTTVSWKHNLKSLRARFPRMTVRMVDGAGHQLLNERPKLRQQVLDTICVTLGPGEGREP